MYIAFKDYNLPPLSNEKMSALSTLKKAAAISSETSLKLPVNTVSFSKDCYFIGNAVKTQIKHFLFYNDAVRSAKYFSLKIPADMGIFISVLR